MARIPGVDPERCEGAVADLLNEQRQTWGQYLQPYLLYARRPPVLRSVRAMWDAFGESGLIPQTLASLVCRRVASLNGCVF